jgi:hypothetical protein
MGVSCLLKRKDLLVLRRSPRQANASWRSVMALLRSAAVPQRMPSSRYQEDHTEGWRAVQSTMAPWMPRAKKTGPRGSPCWTPSRERIGGESGM